MREREHAPRNKRDPNGVDKPRIELPVVAAEGWIDIEAPNGSKTADGQW